MLPARFSATMLSSSDAKTKIEELANKRRAVKEYLVRLREEKFYKFLFMRETKLLGIK